MILKLEIFSLSNVLIEKPILRLIFFFKKKFSRKKSHEKYFRYINIDLVISIFG